MNYIRLATLTLGLMGAAVAQNREHAETSITLHLPAPPAMAFPLFGPVRESEWSPHWSPRFLYPLNPTQSAGAVFTVGEKDAETVWMLSTYDEAGLVIGYVILWHGMCATKLDIALKPAAQNTTEATVTYRRTALSEAGDKYVREFAQDFPSQRDHWEHAISQRLRELAKK
jgi:hypothetical protein